MGERAVSTNMTTEDGQNVIIIIAPSSPSDSVVSSLSVQEPASPGYCPDTDPDWSPSPVSLASPPCQTKPRKKYARSKPRKAPVGPYPTDKKERKKAQMETEFKYLKKLMIEAGLGKYAAAVKY